MAMQKHGSWGGWAQACPQLIRHKIPISTSLSEGLGQQWARGKELLGTNTAQKPPHHFTSQNLCA